MCDVHNMTERPHTSVKAYDCKFQSAIQYDGVTPLPFFLTMSPFNRILISLKKQQNKNIDLYSIFVMKVILCFGRARWSMAVNSDDDDSRCLPHIKVISNTSANCRHAQHTQHTLEHSSIGPPNR